MQPGERERRLLPDPPDTERPKVRACPVDGPFEQSGLPHAGLGQDGERPTPPGPGPCEQILQYGELVVTTTQDNGHIASLTRQ
ncbi:hypothetical protein Airi02_061390 [Actinoallomurus iriomotensis]|uniref:Uncharacterized protein n=1 Tax=Actinoallomurus iriomotensis TaxID=478107 RepID=A0A9W6S9K0_9ACTN|nr:hypothetical protein Airi02_061390 [Actinoallomurus iriomotensis]